MFVYVNISLLNVGDSVGGMYVPTDVLILRKKDVIIRQSSHYTNVNVPNIVRFSLSHFISNTEIVHPFLYKLEKSDAVLKMETPQRSDPLKMNARATPPSITALFKIVYVKTVPPQTQQYSLRARAITSNRFFLSLTCKLFTKHSSLWSHNVQTLGQTDPTSFGSHFLFKQFNLVLCSSTH